MNNFNIFKKIKKNFFILLLCVSAVTFGKETQAYENLPIMDPFEKYNRKTHNFNKFIDKVVLRPASQLYGNYVHQYFRLSAASFHNNLQEPKRFANHLVQGQFARASGDFQRFALNSTVGILGLFDIASWLGFFPEDTDFDETFAYWSIANGPYIELPFLGPSSLRGSFGALADYTVNPLLILSGPIPNLSFATFEIVNIINTRHEYAQVFDSLLYESSDSYSSSRLTFFQRSKSLGQSPKEIPYELFDPLEKF